MALLPARATARGETTLNLDVVVAQAVEAESDKVRGHRLGLTRGRALPATPTVDLAESLGIRLDGETRGVDDDRGQPWLSPVCIVVEAACIGHEPTSGAGPTATMARTPTTSSLSSWGLTPANRRGLLRAGVLLGVGEGNAPTQP